ncbi:C40 family peptidase [Domibacillus antri]|uniref:C40 family peptidase n=1 Tax=Domibacillus antri TaxID=1714264 RepID=UPI0009F86209|nr:C40 family peptidase [Domibacillus antri]
MPCTWVGWGHPTCSGLGAGNIPSSQVTDLATIKKYGGYGVDGDGDGKADPNNLKDAVFAAANYLAASGAAEGRIRDAVYAYNHADWYVEEVMGYADSYVNGYVAIDGGTGGSNSSVVNVGKKWIGNSVYVFGGGRNQSDIARGRFDCSSFVHWAFKQTGVDLGPLGSTSTETLKHLGKPVSPSEMKPGDMVFFDTYKIDGHVGIYVGDGKFIGAQGSTGVEIADMSQGYWKQKFNGRVKRI